MIITITGHRTILEADLPVIDERAHALLDQEDLEEVLIGGALGLDLHVLAYLMRWRQRDRPKVTVVVPDVVESQPWATQNVIRMADECIELNIPITKHDGFQAYHVRNRFMVDRAASVLAFFNGDERSGTSATMHYARRCGKTVEVVGLGKP